MPPKDNPITLGPGTVCFESGDGELSPLGTVQELEYTEESEIDIYGDQKRIVVPQTGEFTLTVNLSPEQYERMKGNALKQMLRNLWREMCALYPNRRVVHLANHHRDPLVRKKNVKRILSCFYIETTKE